LLETERLVLRKPRLDDVDGLLEFAGDGEVMRWIAGEPGGREVALEHVERWLARWDANGVGQFVVLLGERIIGRVGLLVWDSRSWETSSYDLAGDAAESELGWAISSGYWGQGYATEAARAARTWAYEKRGVGRLISLIDPRNVRSIRVADKLGAEPEQLVHSSFGPTLVWLHPR
jgi:RimJ/RimL family protein N-acetyltransferase